MPRERQFLPQPVPQLVSVPSALGLVEDGYVFRGRDVSPHNPVFMKEFVHVLDELCGVTAR